MTQELDESELPEVTWIVFLVTVIVGCIVVRVYGPEKLTTQLHDEHEKETEVEPSREETAESVPKSNDSIADKNEVTTYATDDLIAVQSNPVEPEEPVQKAVDRKLENTKPCSVYALGSGVSHGVCNQLSAFVVIGEGTCQKTSLHFTISAW